MVKHKLFGLFVTSFALFGVVHAAAETREQKIERVRHKILAIKSTAPERYDFIMTQLLCNKASRYFPLSAILSLDCSPYVLDLSEAEGIPTKSYKQDKYKHGNFSAKTAYLSPGGKVEIEVTVVFEKDEVSSLLIRPIKADSTSLYYIDRYETGAKKLIEGVHIDDLDLQGSINGSSLTGGGFMQALEIIKTQTER